MTGIFSRRQILTAGAATGALAWLPSAPALAAPTHRLRATKRVIEVNGKAASMFAIAGDDGLDGARLAPGERFALTLENTCGAPTIIHWHGQTPPVAQDGVTATGYEQPIADGASADYDYAPRPGTHWMHSHLGLQEQQLMAAPLIVHTVEDLRADTQEVTLLLHDFTFRDPMEILASLTSGSTQGGMGMMGGMAMGNGPDLNDVDFDAYLANGRTLDDPQIVRVERGGRVRLRLINGATATAFWIDTGGVATQLIAVDGDAVQPLDISAPMPVAQGQRLDLLLALPAGDGAYPILAQREGDVARTGIILATPAAQILKISPQANAAAGACGISLEAYLQAQAPLTSRPIDRVHRVVLAGSMAAYDWTINGKTWKNHDPLQVKQGERVAFDIFNHSMMAHPMHLHGHHFQVLAIDGHPLPGAVRDTVLVPPMTLMRIGFDANNPGRWLFHCHNLYHMAAGMMTEVRYV
ncbi:MULTISPECIES: multicopper oxidase family protein [Acidocella]|uniref:Multicopper oxidase n=1 Tax=Acidocella aminolytica 101 = DSM 11237 TaxID=1120923 RepID=A0A0D6PHE6_9PROT|nr:MULTISPECIES: multicopper oxidase domain-containing protein [Acidocella]GAN80618.1 multicopper oxidase [Acidocella aminolytica 101 = DSM 11237]GBQ43131.1 putative multicopper oxidase [Acidocella aminolytica 101 = DSM 11237]SHF22129.1 Multicopper oxidase with three cupredoxin domains (includes cell division protein FtsP and spore coat protein CotA) [Acidocella aminolytica 101 = DSM 11237]